LRVVREQGGARRPARVHARLHLPFQIVGVHVHHARHQIVAVQVDGAGSVRAAGLDVGDQPVPDQNRAAHHLVGQHQQRVG
jgi:hypothetical protein